MKRPFRVGYQNLDKEVILDDLPSEGEVPKWLTGTLVRNGPARWDLPKQSVRHWFDGQAMLHKFSFQNGQVDYANKFIRSNTFQSAEKTGKLTYSEFATDPCRNIFQRLMSTFSPSFTTNTNVNITKIANKFIAMTELPIPMEFDPETLETVGEVSYLNEIPMTTTTAHPHYDPERQMGFNSAIHFGRVSQYIVYGQPHDSWDRKVVAKHDVEEPGYLHSFGMSERFIIWTEYPLKAVPLQMLISGKPFADNLTWDPSRKARFLLFDKDTGELDRVVEADPFFCFHHINAYEDGDDVIVDLAAYEDGRIVKDLFMANLREEPFQPLSQPQFRRYHLKSGESHAKCEMMATNGFELPRINYGRINAKPYRYAYGLGETADRVDGYLNQICKVDLESKEELCWHVRGHFPGEPVFVEAPNPQSEDDGVLLSVVLDSDKGISYLLILNAQTMEMVSKTAVSHHIPYGFHGQYFK